MKGRVELGGGGGTSAGAAVALQSRSLRYQLLGSCWKARSSASLSTSLHITTCH